MSNLRSKEKSGCVISLARPCPGPRSSSRVSASHPRVPRARRPPRATPLFSLHRIHRSTPASRVRARPPPSHRARPITPRVSRGHPPSRAYVIIHRHRPRPDDDERDERDARTHACTLHPVPFPLAHRIASHRTRRTHDAARASDAMRRPPRRRLGRVAETWGSRGGTHDESRPVTIARDARDSIGPSSDRRRAMPRSGTGDDKKRTIVTYIHSECRCVWDGCS